MQKPRLEVEQLESREVLSTLSTGLADYVPVVSSAAPRYPEVRLVSEDKLIEVAAPRSTFVVIDFNPFPVLTVEAYTVVILGFARAEAGLPRSNTWIIELPARSGREGFKTALMAAMKAKGSDWKVESGEGVTLIVSGKMVNGVLIPVSGMEYDITGRVSGTRTTLPENKRPVFITPPGVRTGYLGPGSPGAIDITLALALLEDR